MEKLLKVMLVGRFEEDGHLDTNHRDAVAIYVDPFDKALKTFVLQSAYQRFPWLANVAQSNICVYWIDEEGDRISIYTEADMEICVEHGGKIPKLYIDLTKQTAVKVAVSSQHPNEATSSSDAEHESDELHINVECDGCSGVVCGFRYKCVQCRDFDLCQACEAKGLHKEHVMYRMPKPFTDLGARVDRHIIKCLRKGVPKEGRSANGHTTNRSKRSEARSSGGGCKTGAQSTAPPCFNLPGANVTPDYVADAIFHVRNSEKISSVALDVISNLAQNFSTIMDPFGSNLATAFAASAGHTDFQPKTKETTPTPEVPKTNASDDNIKKNNTSVAVDESKNETESQSPDREKYDFVEDKDDASKPAK